MPLGRKMGWVKGAKEKGVKNWKGAAGAADLLLRYSAYVHVFHFLQAQTQLMVA